MKIKKSIIKDFQIRNYNQNGIIFPLVEVSYHHLMVNRWFFRIWIKYYCPLLDLNKQCYVEFYSNSKFFLRKALLKASLKYLEIKTQKK